MFPSPQCFQYGWVLWAFIISEISRRAHWKKRICVKLSEIDLSMLIRLPLPQCFCPRGRKLRPWSEENSDQNSDHPRHCIYWGKEKLRPWSEFLGRENSDHGLSFGCFWGRGRRGGSQSSNCDNIAHPSSDAWNEIPTILHKFGVQPWASSFLVSFLSFSTSLILQFSDFLCFSCFPIFLAFPVFRFPLFFFVSFSLSFPRI